MRRPLSDDANIALLIILWAVALGAAMLWQERPTLKMPAQGYVPDVLLVRKHVSDRARVCVEGDAEPYPCRTVGELRRWIWERGPAK